MFRKVTSEVSEIVWLASVVGVLSVVGVGIAVAAVMVLERLPQV